MTITREIFQVGADGLTAAGDGAIYLIDFGVYRGKRETANFIKSFL